MIYHLHCVYLVGSSFQILYTEQRQEILQVVLVPSDDRAAVADGERVADDRGAADTDAGAPLSSGDVLAHDSGGHKYGIQNACLNYCSVYPSLSALYFIHC